MTVGLRDVVDDDPVYLSTLSKRSLGMSWVGMRGTSPSSGTYNGAQRAFYYPFYTQKPYSLARWWWLNGATVGTTYFQMGIYDASFQLFRASPFTLSAGTINQIQYANPGIHAISVTSGSSTTDGDTFATASVSLKAGEMYLIAVTNSHASSAPAISTVSGGPTFASRSSVQFNGTLDRVSIWSTVPTVNYSGTLTIDFGASSGVTGCIWSLVRCMHVDTTTNHGIVQNATGTGTSVTPLATLSAFGSAANATFGAFGVGAGVAGTPSTGYWEYSDANIASPALAQQTVFRPDNDTTVDETISSNAWGAAAVEIKSLGTGAIVIPPMRGYLAIWGDSTTGNVFRLNAIDYFQPHMYLESSLTRGLLETATPGAASSNKPLYVCGLTKRGSP